MLLGSGVVRLVIPFKRQQRFRHYILLTADRHLDSPYSNHVLQRRHLEQAKERGALVIDLGDLFDAMQGRDDPRRTKQALRNMRLDAPYWDALVDEAYAFFEPYRDHIAMLGRGNHEYRVLKHAETDLTARLADRLGTIAAGYRGFVELNYRRSDGQSIHSFVLYYTHGSGSGGEVTRGTIRTNRRAVYVPDADVIISGHIHESWLMELPRLRLYDGSVSVETQFHLQLPSYKQEIMKQEWWDVKDYAPKAVGAWWLETYWDTREQKLKLKFSRAD